MAKQISNPEYSVFDSMNGISQSGDAQNADRVFRRILVNGESYNFWPVQYIVKGAANWIIRRIVEALDPSQMYSVETHYHKHIVLWVLQGEMHLDNTST